MGQGTSWIAPGKGKASAGIVRLAADQIEEGSLVEESIQTEAVCDVIHAGDGVWNRGVLYGDVEGFCNGGIEGLWNGGSRLEFGIVRGS